jgi:hypothetical protein
MTEKIISPVPKRRIKMPGKVTGIVILIIVLIIGGSVLTYLHNRSNHNKVTAALATKEYALIYDSASDRLNSNQGNLSDPIDQLNNLLTYNLSSQQRFNVLTQLGFGYLRLHENTQSLNAFLAADKLEPGQTGTTVDGYIASLFSDKGDKSSAIAYYKKGIAAATSKNAGPYDSTLVPTYKSSIISLGGTP